MAGADPVIARNAGSLGARDLHLEDFSVSNGGPNLIEDASIMMAFGRRYGLVSRSTAHSKRTCPAHYGSRPRHAVAQVNDLRC